MGFVFESCPFCSEFLTDLCYGLCYILLWEATSDAFVIPLIFFRARHDLCLCVLSLQTLELVQTKNSMRSLSVRFSSRILNLSSKANHFGWKITKKVLKLTKLMTQISSSKFRLIYFMKRVTKSTYSSYPFLVC